MRTEVELALPDVSGYARLRHPRTDATFFSRDKQLAIYVLHEPLIRGVLEKLFCLSSSDQAMEPRAPSQCFYAGAAW